LLVSEIADSALKFIFDTLSTDVEFKLIFLIFEFTITADL
jgi:hypothetical protein